MRATLRFFILPSLVLGCLGSALAQSQPAAPARADSPPPAGGRPEQQIEKIRHEDAGSRIDELRVGGETRSITVQPKGAVPPYELSPDSSNRNPAAAGSGSEGKRGWNLFKF